MSRETTVSSKPLILPVLCATSAVAAAYFGPRAEQRLGDRDLFWWSAMSRRNRAAVWRFQVVAFSVMAVGLLLLAALG
jgi:hypothetical protein